MGLYTMSLNSGSNANCYYVGTRDNGILIDAGLNFKQTAERLAVNGLSIKNISGIFITHEHTDHVKGLASVLHKHPCTIYASAGTLNAIRRYTPVADAVTVACSQMIRIGPFELTAFNKFHDASEPQSVIISHAFSTVGIFTDHGRICEKLKNYFNRCNAVYLEANYDDEMLANGNYPYFLKTRITGGRGHLSNTEAANFACAHFSKKLTHVFASHLSEKNNCPHIVAKVFTEKLPGICFEVSSRYQASKLYYISGIASRSSHIKKAVHSTATGQLSLF